MDGRMEDGRMDGRINQHSVERTKSDLKVQSFLVTQVIREMVEPSAKHRGRCLLSFNNPSRSGSSHGSDHHSLIR